MTCAVWLTIVHKSNYDDRVVADGWAARAERLVLDAPRIGPLRGLGADSPGLPAPRPRAGRAADPGRARLRRGNRRRLGAGRDVAARPPPGRARRGGIRPPRRGGDRQSGRGGRAPGHRRLHLLRHAGRLRAGGRPAAGGPVARAGRRVRRALRLPVPGRGVPARVRQHTARRGSLGPRVRSCCRPWPCRVRPAHPPSPSGPGPGWRCCRCAVATWKRQRRCWPRPVRQPVPRSPVPLSPWRSTCPMPCWSSTDPAEVVEPNARAEVLALTVEAQVREWTARRGGRSGRRAPRAGGCEPAPVRGGARLDGRGPAGRRARRPESGCGRAAGRRTAAGRPRDESRARGLPPAAGPATAG